MFKDVMERVTSGSAEIALEVSNSSFSWDDSSPIPTLRDVSFEVSHGMNVAACGTVGSGKSSLLSSVLGEVPKISETVKKVLEACSLNKDLELLPFHDQTVIGERDIYLFDDPFSAVNAHIGSHLFKEVILGILKDKTVIYTNPSVVDPLATGSSDSAEATSITPIIFAANVSS
ncbi:hypothetical protein Bca52824_022919 [Brassica carinata]|uniref:ABC transporter domain-containing protein n=1 Tax=Brassica carinata TaxID=52824 RepID=A0A8X8ATR1_BRACI|nr:hypothetical protein Bca52824_022919 [Brassica carinata]